MPVLQESVDRYVRALAMPERLIRLHPARIGNSGDASAIAPAVVLMSVSAFEGFVEDLAAAGLHLQGHSYTYMAKVVGNWTNPDIKLWHEEPEKQFGVSLAAAFSVRTTRGVQSSNWSAKKVSYPDAEKLGSAWMNVRHALTHGSASAKGSERWPAANRKGEPVSLVLRPQASDKSKHYLELPGARGCAALHTFAARHGADKLAAKLRAPTLKWKGCPEFDHSPQGETGNGLRAKRCRCVPPLLPSADSHADDSRLPRAPLGSPSHGCWGGRSCQK